MGRLSQQLTVIAFLLVCATTIIFACGLLSGSGALMQAGVRLHSFSVPWVLAAAWLRLFAPLERPGR